VRTDAPDTAHAAATCSDVPSAKARWRFRLAVALIVSWLVVLSLLSYFTANPVTLNRDQILESADVLTAVVENPATGNIRVLHAWKQKVDEKTLTLPNLKSTEAVSGETYLIPISGAGDEWSVKPSKLPQHLPLIYPATPEAERQLKSLLETGHLP
jgi:anti-sigma-K factor RskA